MIRTLFVSLTLSACINSVLASPLSSLSFAGIEDNTQPSATAALIAQTQDKAKDIIDYGKSLIGTPYVYGGTTPKGFDCSGLVQYVYKHAGISLPRTSRAQYQTLEKVSKPEIGDLVFFSHGKRVSHVGIYIGDNKMLHAPSSGKQVEITSLSNPYWQKRYVGARRILDKQNTNNTIQIVAQTSATAKAESKQAQPIFQLQ